jgi:hypothetical protein
MDGNNPFYQPVCLNVKVIVSARLCLNVKVIVVQGDRTITEWREGGVGYSIFEVVVVGCWFWLLVVFFFFELLDC